ncbi:hypothetical protein [Embleya sp. NPDC005971]|uniref:hypothetical protein n=1 Tax=Embleya sp. NPDC005971 TaxID=3156724 RepID=UPI0033E7D697
MADNTTSPAAPTTSATDLDYYRGWIELPPTPTFPFNVIVSQGEDGATVFDIETNPDCPLPRDRNGTAPVRVWVDSVCVYDQGDETPDLA